MNPDMYIPPTPEKENKPTSTGISRAELNRRKASGEIMKTEDFINQEVKAQPGTRYARLVPEKTAKRVVRKPMTEDQIRKGMIGSSSSSRH